MLISLVVYCLLGAIAGVLAGLLGVGGGIVIVPMLVFAFGWQNFPPDVLMLMALGTSMGSIMFTSISSSLAHSRNKGVQWDAVRNITPGILIGTFCGSFLASHVPARFLQLFFVAFLFFVITQMLSGKKPKPSRHLPGLGGMSVAGGIIGVVSSLVGIGGGTLSVPFLLWNNLDMRKAIGTSAAIGFPIALAGCFGYIVNGCSASSSSACSPLRWVRASPRPFRSPNLRNASPSCSSSSASGCCSRRCKQTAPKGGEQPRLFYGQHPFPAPSDARRQGPEDEHGDRPESMGKDAGDEAVGFPVEPAPEQPRRQGGHDQHEVP